MIIGGYFPPNPPTRLQLPSLVAVCECYHSRSPVGVALPARRLKTIRRVLRREPHSVDRPPPPTLPLLGLYYYCYPRRENTLLRHHHLRERATRNPRRITCLADRPRDQSISGVFRVGRVRWQCQWQQQRERSTTIIPRETPVAS